MSSSIIFIGPTQSIVRRNTDSNFRLLIVSKVAGDATIDINTTVVGGMILTPTVTLEEDVPATLTGVAKKAGIYNISASILNEAGELEESDSVVVTVSQMESELEETCVDVLDQEEWILPEVGKQNSPMFLGDKEKEFQKHINQEIVERITNETVLYYAVDVENTQYHLLYGEALIKKFWPPVRIPCLIEWKPQETKNDKFTIDRVPVMAVHVLKRRIEEDVGLNMMVGDFVFYGRDFYEIVEINSPTKLYGDPTRQVEIILTCVKARQGTFYVESQEKLKINSDI